MQNLRTQTKFDLLKWQFCTSRLINQISRPERIRFRLTEISTVSECHLQSLLNQWVNWIFKYIFYTLDVCVCVNWQCFMCKRVLNSNSQHVCVNPSKSKGEREHCKTLLVQKEKRKPCHLYGKWQDVMHIHISLYIDFEICFFSLCCSLACVFHFHKPILVLLFIALVVVCCCFFFDLYLSM